MEWVYRFAMFMRMHIYTCKFTDKSQRNVLGLHRKNPLTLHTQTISKKSANPKYTNYKQKNPLTQHTQTISKKSANPTNTNFRQKIRCGYCKDY